MRSKRVIIAAGGTGGHVFPALAIGEEIREQWPGTEILYVGTKRGLEDRVIPKAGFKLRTITMSGLARGFSTPEIWNNLVLPIKLLAGMIQSIFIIVSFRPDAIVGCGGYVTGPILLLGALAGRKTFLQEQNSRPGRTTIFLSRFATQVHLTYEEAGRFLKKTTNIRLTGNPLRRELRRLPKAEARQLFGLNTDKPTVLVVGGSLGARSINEAMADLVHDLTDQRDIQFIWQTGRTDYDTLKRFAGDRVFVTDFIEDMSAAYSSADLIVCRAGAMTLSEITMMGLAGILVPYPFAAENHQEFNARSLVDRNAAVLILNKDLKNRLRGELERLIESPALLEQMKKNSASLHKPNAASDFVKGMETALHAAGN